MTKAIEPVKKKALELGIKSIEIDVALCNKASTKVATEKAKAKRERNIPIRGGDGKEHKGARYVLTIT